MYPCSFFRVRYQLDFPDKTQRNIKISGPSERKARHFSFVWETFPLIDHSTRDNVSPEMNIQKDWRYIDQALQELLENGIY